MKTRTMLVGLVAVLGCEAVGCEDHAPTTDEKQSKEQAMALAQAHAQVGMPAISDFAEKRMMKDLYEARDKPLPTHTYLVNEMTGCLNYMGPSLGYGLPYGTQYTAPVRIELHEGEYGGGNVQVPQPEPNGLFMPPSADGTWVMMKNPTEDKVQAVYFEPRVIVSPFRITARECPEVQPPQPPKKP